MFLQMKRILCPTDFSEPSYEGLKAANALAAHFSSELLLIHVVSTAQILSVTAAELLPKIVTEIETSAKILLEKIAREKIAAGVRFQTSTVQGGPAEEIVKAAQEAAVDWIVMATHGQSGLKKFISGSVAERVVRLADRPVLTVQPTAPEE